MLIFQVETSSLKLILAMMFHYIDNMVTCMSPDEAACCLTICIVLAECPVMWISLLAKASITVLHTDCIEDSNSVVKISDAAFEMLSEYILETVGSSRDHYKGFSTVEVLKVYFKLVFEAEENCQIFKQSSLLSEHEVVTYIKEYESVQVQEDSGNKSGTLLLYFNMLFYVQHILYFSLLFYVQNGYIKSCYQILPHQ